MTRENTARQLLLSLGMGDYNATMAIQHMMIAPAATDPDMPSIILMTKHLQLGLQAAGARDVVATGRIDDATARALIKLVGPEWNQVTWYALFQAVLDAKRHRVLDAGAIEVGLPTLPAIAPPSTMGLLPDLPSMPGGAFGWAAIGVAAWYFLIRKKH